MKKNEPGTFIFLLLFTTTQTTAQNVGIGTTQPLARLHVADSSVVFTAAGIAGTSGNPPVSGSGRRMMWYPDKAAFRSGYVAGTHWNRDSIGSFSTAVGINTKATGHASFAAGNETSAAGNSTIALGYLSQANGYVAIAIGNDVKSFGSGSLATGAYSYATGDYSMCAGLGTLSGGYGSFSSGVSTSAKAYGSFVTGSENDVSDNPSPMNPAADDRIFQVGNGFPPVLSNAVTILRNGNTGIGNTDPFYKLDISGRVRIRSGGDNSSTAGIWLNNNANNISPGFMGMESDDAMGFYGNTTPNGWGLVMQISTGNLGVGTSAPGAKLHVMGSVLANGYITASDARFKKNIRPILNPITALRQLHGVMYDMNTANYPQWQFEKATQYGLVAQELEQVFPSMVKTIDSDGHKGIDYVKLIPVLIEGIKDLQQQLEKLEKEMASLKTKQP